MIKGLSIGYIVASLIDLIQTLYGTSVLGLEEANPIMRSFIDIPIILIVFKVVITLLVAVGFYRIWEIDKTKGAWIAGFGFVFQTLIIISNFVVIGTVL